MTDYIVLKQDHGEAWSVRGHAQASGPMVARKLVDLSDGVYLVVPMRNATFISATTDQPPPRPMSVEVSADSYLPNIGEATGEPREGIEVPLGETAELTA